MRQATILGLLAGLLVLALLTLVLFGHDADHVTTALTSALTLIVGVLVTGLVGAKATSNGSGGNNP